MKKILVFFALFAALIFVVSCGGGGSSSDNNSSEKNAGELGGECYPNKSCNEGLICDEESNLCVEDSENPTDPTDEPTDDPTNPTEPTDPTDNPTDEPTQDEDADTSEPEPDEDTDTTPVSDEDTDIPEPNDEDGDTTPIPDEDADTDPIIEMEEGIYLGIIGFNDDLTISFEDLGQKPIKRLTDANKNEFKNFISSLQQKNYTALYWADYHALEIMRDYTISPDLQLKKVALVTFTDGLDNQSLTFDAFNPGPYDSHEDYMEAIHTIIMDEDGIHGQPVAAYSIGLKGADVSDEEKFNNTLNKLASECAEDDEECKYVFQVTDMNEVENNFAAIADSLYQVSTTINVGVYIPGGYDNGQIIRYTFDNVSAAASSNLYIEATYNRSGSTRTLKNIKYEGFMDGAPEITSSDTGLHGELYFQFNDLKYSDGRTVSQSEIMSRSRLWKQTSSGGWDGESEMNMQELPPVINEDKSSALIMLVLDSTTSLGSDFARMQQAAKKFVETLVSGGSGVTESSPCDDNPCATLANSTHICTVSGSSYTCGCNSGYTWNGWQCSSTSTPCNPNPCTSISNSTGVCTVNGTGYTCGCQSGYTWNGGSCTSSSSPDNLTLGNICTGQTSCYNASSSMTCPSSSSADFYGQDAQYTSKCTAQSFTVQTISSQKVVLDNNTGLMWQQTAPSTTYTWENAKNYCNNLTYAGYSDWRLPNPQELLTIVDNSKYGPAINTTYFPNMSSASASVYYWSSKPYGTDRVQLLRLYYGNIYYTTSYTQSSSLNLVCVRGNELPKASFTTQTISGEVVVKDSTTGLMWQKTYPSGTKTWANALKYCESLVYAGYDDWRLPNKNELASLVNYDKTEAPYSDFPYMPTDYYFWSSSAYVCATGNAWGVRFDSGPVSGLNKASNYDVRCVR